MELLVPILGLACVFLLGLLADFYLLVQFVVALGRGGRGHWPWSALWMLGNALLLCGLLLRFTLLPATPALSLLLMLGTACVFASPFCWLAALYRFRRVRFKEQAGPEAGSQNAPLCDVGAEEGVWPPPPKR